MPLAGIAACTCRTLLAAGAVLATDMTHLFELFRDEQRTVGHPHVTRRKLLKERDAVGIDEEHIRQIQNERWEPVTAVSDRLVAHTTKFLHPGTCDLAFET
jgi:hypothetical protein